MAIRTDQRFSGDPEPFQMHLMADAVSGAGKINPVLFGNRLDIAMVIRVLKAGLQRIMVDVRHAPLGLYAVDPHCLKFEICHSSRSILR